MYIKKKILLWGYGAKFDYVYKKIIEEFWEKCISGVIDSIAFSSKFNIIRPCEIREYEYDLIIVTVINKKSIKSIRNEALSLDVSSDKIYFFWEDYKNLKIYNLECQVINAPYEYIGAIRRPIVKSGMDLLRRIIYTNCSLSRYGDGEFELMFGRKRSWFQKNDERLKQRLRDIFIDCNENDNIIIAIPDNFGSLEKYTEKAADGIRDYNTISRKNIYSLINFDLTYYDSYVTRPYMIYKDKSNAYRIFQLFKKVWDKRCVCIVEGKFARNGLNNDLFENATKISRIICPPENAFDNYDNILNEIVVNVPSDTLILISLGPTATVLTYDLSERGYQAIDIGQLDNEYDWYRMGAESPIDIQNKQVAEVNLEVVDKGTNISKKYYDQIVSAIL